jgi:chemotaxis protein histidine kinase CheA
MEGDKILNPATGRYVLKTGKIGKELMKALKTEPAPKKDSPKAKKDSPKAKKDSPKAKKDSPKAKKDSPKAKKDSPKAKKDSPKAKKDSPKAKKDSPKAKKDSPKAKKDSPKAKKDSGGKTININELKSEWIKVYEKSTESLTYNLHQSKDNLLDVRLSRTAKIIGLTGEGTLYLRKIKDIAMANKERIEIYLPKNYTGKHFANPMWNRVHGYMYYLNDYNLRILSRIVYTINYINAKYKNYKISENVATEAVKTHGIIGIDILYNEPVWVTDVLKGNPLQNPILNENGQIIFSKCAISTKTVEKANAYLQKKMPKDFKTLYPKYINMRSTKTVSKELKAFIDSDYTVANIAYALHARIIFKNGGKLYIIDPWKQAADPGTKNLIKMVPNLSFIKRDQEQTTEGSCTAVSYARALYIAMQGVDKIYEKIPLDYIVLASRLISKFRT